MTKGPLGSHQVRWIARIRAAGGVVEMEVNNGLPILLIPVVGGSPIRLPARMFESLVDRDLFVLEKDTGIWKRWRLIEEPQESGS